MTIKTYTIKPLVFEMEEDFRRVDCLYSGKLPFGVISYSIYEGKGEYKEFLAHVLKIDRTLKILSISPTPEEAIEACQNHWRETLEQCLEEAKSEL